MSSVKNSSNAKPVVKSVEKVVVSPKIVEVFGKFLYQISGKTLEAATRSEAEVAIAGAAVGEAAHVRAVAYSAFLNVDGKTAVGKQNIVEGFLAWEAAGSPVYVKPVPKAEAPADKPESSPEL